MFVCHSFSFLAYHNRPRSIRVHQYKGPTNQKRGGKVVSTQLDTRWYCSCHCSRSSQSDPRRPRKVVSWRKPYQPHLTSSAIRGGQFQQVSDWKVHRRKGGMSNGRTWTNRVCKGTGVTCESETMAHTHQYLSVCLS
jgi:hypothetical protein